MTPRPADSLTARIREQGPLAFDAFMHRALYEPGLGFYSSGQTRTGRTGDFLTPVSAGPVLGALLARQADELHRVLGRPPNFHLVEQGADTGALARDLVLAIRKNHPGLAASVQLHLLEPHPLLESRQRQTLREAGLETCCRWHSSWEALPAGEGPWFFYSCELVDSFPVKLFRFHRGSWQEKWVRAEGSRLAWEERPAEAGFLPQIRRWNPPEVEGYTAELRPGMRSWVKGWSEKIHRGLVLTLDYGFPARELFSPARTSGTLMAIRNHRRVEDPLDEPGQADLTAHVNFTELEELAAQAGFRNYGLTDFSRGLTALAAPLLREGEKPSESWIRNFRQLTHPSFLGHTHRILVQGKSLPPSFTPSMLIKL